MLALPCIGQPDCQDPSLPKHGTQPELGCLFFHGGRLGNRADRPSSPYGRAVCLTVNRWLVTPCMVNMRECGA